MKLSRLRSGELTALAGALALLALLFADWFALRTPAATLGAHESGWRSLGWLALAFVLAAVLVALALAAATVGRSSPALPVVLADCAIVLGALAALVLAARLLVQPDLGVSAAAEDVVPRLPAYLGLLAALAIALGAWRTLADERTNTTEAREQTERVLRVRGAPRPVPPPRTPQPPGPPDPLAGPARPEA